MDISWWWPTLVAFIVVGWPRRGRNAKASGWCMTPATSSWRGGTRSARSVRETGLRARTPHGRAPPRGAAPVPGKGALAFPLGPQGWGKFTWAH